jgi:hypothetical protein
MESSFVSCRSARVDDSAVLFAICVPKRETGRYAPLNDQLAPVQCTMVGATDGDEIVNGVIAAFGAKRHVM